MLAILSNVSSVRRQDFSAADSDLLNPLSTVPLALEQGEWVTFDADGKVIRVTASVRPSYQAWSPKGDMGAQALGKLSVIFIGDYEAETDMYDSAVTYTIGEPLTAKTVTIDAEDRAGLTNDVTGATDYIVGYVTKVPGDSGKLRYQKINPQLSVA